MRALLPVACSGMQRTRIEHGSADQSTSDGARSSTRPGAKAFIEVELQTSASEKPAATLRRSSSTLRHERGESIDKLLDPLAAEVQSLRDLLLLQRGRFQLFGGCSPVGDDDLLLIGLAKCVFELLPQLSPHFGEQVGRRLDHFQGLFQNRFGPLGVFSHDLPSVGQLLVDLILQNLRFEFLVLPHIVEEARRFGQHFFEQTARGGWFRGACKFQLRFAGNLRRRGDTGRQLLRRFANGDRIGILRIAGQRGRGCLRIE